MVFIFGLIHGFGLSTKLQEVAVMSKINLTLMQILSFNVGVEFGHDFSISDSISIVIFN